MTICEGKPEGGARSTGIENKARAMMVGSAGYTKVSSRISHEKEYRLRLKVDVLVIWIFPSHMPASRGGV